ncbi:MULTISPECIES: fluoride efflux transporter CrcB [unclassified Haladaptatus]|uniref:fluoride efflux transporter CrcB n=1 Tax=unclassified Haladaptatus TaxID=2622732 RepID=UPI00209C4796|nr:MULTISPECIES: fluoride efflux transporter CrcB [unclassified Haladaptatus]MCO8244576.1 fluoride efflux transporter CrcB [Haladaptatus sp. AB643]MCO8253802.1 fluoride efflux transporter CrcB [Haladaptatus sp. AB618]
MGRTHPLHTLEVLLLVGVGGFAGSNLRYFVSLVQPGLTGTLIANVAGSFALGFILYEAIYMGYLADQTHVVVGTGFLSSFTTYSTFAVQTTQAASPLWMIGNVAANYGLGLMGVLLGRTLARNVNGRSKEAEKMAEQETTETEVPE